jgi:hypothetical protein
MRSSCRVKVLNRSVIDFQEVPAGLFTGLLRFIHEDMEFRSADI